MSFKNNTIWKFYRLRKHHKESEELSMNVEKGVTLTPPVALPFLTRARITQKIAETKSTETHLNYFLSGCRCL